MTTPISEPPDIVIHSFGSKLFVLLLELEEFSDLKFGRVIVTGSVIRTDFEWSKVISKGQVEAILNHCGGKDYAVPFAQFFIPGTGPAGKYGFSDNKTLNAMSPEYGHSSCFKSDALTDNLQDGGLWDQFLRNTVLSSSDDRLFLPESANWRPIHPIIGFLVRTLTIGLLTAVLAIVFFSLINGLSNLVSGLL